jgi:hypothetical protein
MLSLTRRNKKVRIIRRYIHKAALEVVKDTYQRNLKQILLCRTFEDKTKYLDNATLDITDLMKYCNIDSYKLYQEILEELMDKKNIRVSDTKNYHLYGCKDKFNTAYYAREIMGLQINTVFQNLKDTSVTDNPRQLINLVEYDLNHDNFIRKFLLRLTYNTLRETFTGHESIRNSSTSVKIIITCDGFDVDNDKFVDKFGTLLSDIFITNTTHKNNDTKICIKQLVEKYKISDKELFTTLYPDHNFDDVMDEKNSTNVFIRNGIISKEKYLYLHERDMSKTFYKNIIKLLLDKSI